MARVVLKSEIHSSKADLQEEKQLLQEGFDVLILEAPEGDSDYRWWEGWFLIMIKLFRLVVSSFTMILQF